MNDVADMRKSVITAQFHRLRLKKHYQRIQASVETFRELYIAYKDEDSFCSCCSNHSPNNALPDNAACERAEYYHLSLFIAAD